MDKCALAVVGYQHDSLTHAADDAARVQQLHDNIQSFIAVNEAGFSSIVVACHSLSPFSPHFAENWRFASNGLPVPVGSLLYRSGETAFHVATQRVTYRFPTILPRFLPALPKEFMLTDPLFSANSSGAQSCVPETLETRVDVVCIDEQENAPANTTPFRGNPSTVFVVGSMLSPSVIDVICRWARGARVCVLTDLTRGSVFDRGGIDTAHSFDIFGRSYIASPVPLHIQPVRGGRAEAERMWGASVKAMQALASALRPVAPGPEIAAPKGPTNPVCRDLPAVRGTLPMLGPNYVFVTVFRVHADGDGLGPRYMAVTGKDVHAIQDSYLFDPRAVCDQVWGPNTTVSFGDPFVVYAGYLPDAQNTLYAWKHCMVMAVEINGISVDAMAKVDRNTAQRTAFENEMCRLVRHIDAYRRSDGINAVCRAVRTASAYELEALLGKDAYTVGSALLHVMGASRGHMDGDALCAWLERGLATAGAVVAELEEHHNVASAVGNDHSRTIPVLNLSNKDTDWTRIIYGDGARLREFFKKITIGDLDDARAARLMLRATMERNIDRFLRAVSAVVGPDLPATEHGCRMAASGVADVRVFIKTATG